MQFSALQKFHQGGPDPVRCHLIARPPILPHGLTILRDTPAGLRVGVQASW